MKRSCETCLWWDWDEDTHVEQRRGNCRCFDPPAHFLPAVWPVTLSTDWCYKWEPRDRSLVRCETCEWYSSYMGGTCQLNAPTRHGSSVEHAYTDAELRCSHWRLREERDDA